MDNNKNYKWSPEDQFTITGKEFDIFQKTIAVFSEFHMFLNSSMVVNKVLSDFIPSAVETRKTILERLIQEGLIKEEVINDDSVTEENVINPS